MCGLVGVLSSDMTGEKLRIFQGLMVVATLRGQTGAGLAVVPRPKKHVPSVRILRHPTLTAAELVYDQEFYKYTKEPGSITCCMGHARAPTTGGFEIADTHPHVARHIIGMHNGHMRTVAGTEVPKKQNDSAMLFDAIGNQGIEQVIQHSVGAYALSIYNKQTQRLYFLRNSHRPIHFCMVEGDNKTLFWASEAQMLQLVVGRSVNGKLHHYTLPADELISFPAFENGDIRFEDRKTVKSEAPKEKDVTDKTRMMYPTVSGQYFERNDMLAMLTHGCANCNAAHTMEDYLEKKIVWFAPKEFMCRECLTHDQTARDYVTCHGIALPHDLPPIVPTTH